jgi:ABC-type lipoprotein export system ATPase subunit
VKTYETAAGPFPALKDVDLQIDGGEFVAIIGKSGSGKSTLVNMITGIDRPTSGQVFVGDTAVHTLSEGQLAQWRGRTVGVIFQFFQLLPTLTVIENIMLPMDFCHMYSTRERRERAMYLLEQVELADQAFKLPSAVSGGQQQRAAIARALANDPPILLADEPTGNLDSKTAESVFRLFENQVEQGKTIVMVTHDRDLSKRATRTIMLADGEIIEQYLVSAFPALTERQLVRATRNLERENYSPGSIILQEGTAPDKFFIITRGQIEVLVDAADGERLVVARMGRGQYFGEIELLRGGANIATIRAAVDSGARVVTLDHETFATLMAESQPARDALEQVVQERLAENINGRNGVNHA